MGDDFETYTALSSHDPRRELRDWLKAVSLPARDSPCDIFRGMEEVSGVRNQRAQWYRGVVLAAVIIPLLLSFAVMAAPPPASQAEGAITAVSNGAVIVTTATGSQVRIMITGDATLIQRKSVKLEDIKANDLVGVTARRETDGSLTAISINIFPAEFKGRVRLAQFVMDTGNIMTNATVFQNVRRIEGRTLYLKLGDGTAVIAVPKEVEVIRLTVIKFGDLKPGMRVVVRGTTGSDGSLIATTITVDAR